MARKVQKLNLSDHTLNINTRKCNYEKFDFSEVEEYVRVLVGDREYQFNCIKQIMIYLWGGSYKDITQLAKENWTKKSAIQERFQSEENFMRHLPLPDRLSGVVHMATGTGKSYVMFAIAYLSLVLGKTKRVLVLGPSSTVIEKGLTGKFREYLFGKTGLNLHKKLPKKYQNIHINLLNENDPIVDNSIVIENINSIYNKENNSIGDTLFLHVDEVMVLSDEVHHAYSHLKYTGAAYVMDGEEGTGDTRDERLWLKFIREEEKITRHIGFTGTPYNQDEYFCDVIYDYSIKDAMDDKCIKKIDPIIKTESDEGDTDLTLNQRFQQILDTHYTNKEKYSYPDSNGNPKLKPITIFINNKQSSARNNNELFIQILADYLRDKNSEYASLPESQLRQIAIEKVICVISKPTDADYQDKLDAIEEIDPNKTGGNVEFVFAVNKLSEGWDVDNVYQIVPMEERVFDSKLLISQVLGRGLRLPRKVNIGDIYFNYPVVTITNHEKFADHIKELVYAVTMCETKFISTVFDSDAFERFKYHLRLFNLEYMPTPKIEKAKELKQDMKQRELVLYPQREKLGLNVTYLISERRFELKKDFYTLDQIASEIADRFAMRQFEEKHFDFGDGFVLEDLPGFDDIERVIVAAMEKAGIKERKLAEENKKAIELFFNQFLPRGTKKRVLVNVEGNVLPIYSLNMDTSSIRSSEIEKYRSVFISEDYLSELGEENQFVIHDLQAKYKRNKRQLSLFQVDSFKSEYVRQLIGEIRLYVVNTSLFKTPQNLVIVSHDPERDFVFKLIDNANYIDSWIKSRDMGFYSLSYEFWKGGKDRVRRSFNPDFFIKIDLSKYITKISGNGNKDALKKLYVLQDQGIKELMRVVEIKSDEDQEDITRAKERDGKEHFERLNKRLLEINPFDVPEDFRTNKGQHYTFDLLRPETYNNWFLKLKEGIF